MSLHRFLQSRVLVWAGFMGLALFLAVRIGFPFLIQTDTVSQQIEVTLEAWTGTNVEAGRDVQFSFWPYPRVTISKVRMIGTDKAAGEIELAHVESISASFDLFGAVRGKPVFSDFELVRPTVRVGWDAAGVFNWRHSGWLMQAIDATASTAEGQAIPELAEERIGSLNVLDGSIEVIRAGGQEPYRISDINGTIDWPALRRSLSLSLSGVVNGEMTRWTFECDRPLSLLAGHNANVRTNIAADPTTLNFEGLANLSTNAFISGTMALSTPSLGHLLAWQGKEIPSVDNLGLVNVEAKVTTAGYAAKLENVRLTLDNAEATGVLDVNMTPNAPPQIGGTLAFDRIDLRGLLTALSTLPADKGTAGIDTAFIHQFGMDLRLSAKTADFAPFSMQELAAGIRNENGRASLDIGDSLFMGGRMTGRVALTEQGLRGGGRLQMSLSNVDFGAIVSTLDLAGPLPVGRGSADIELATDRPLWASSASDMSGRFRLQMGPGTLTHFNPQTFEERTAMNTFFSYTETSDGSFDFLRADIDAKLDRGLAELTKAEIEGTEKLLSLSGMIPYRTGSMALAGTLRDKQQADPSVVVKPSVSFFVGGSWPEPVISPISILTGQTPRQ